jgi:hypothetical protein
MQWGREPGQRLLEANPTLGLHQMHDANQDRLMISDDQLKLTAQRVAVRGREIPYWTVGPGHRWCSCTRRFESLLVAISRQLGGHASAVPGRLAGLRFDLAASSGIRAG